MPRRRRSRGEWAELVAAWRASGQSRDDFARHHGLNPNTLSWWSVELRRGAGRKKSSTSAERVTFVRMLTQESPPSPPPAPMLEVVLGTGLSVRVPVEVDAGRVADIVAALRRRES